MISRERVLKLMSLAIDEAKKSIAEDRATHPYVGAVLADGEGNIIATAHRGETGSGRHAEYIVLTKASELQADLSNAELFITLEPCTARGPEKTPCADRIQQIGIRRVYIGMLDPNPQILGRGETRLRGSDVEVERFPGNLIKELEKLNEDFIRHHKDSHLPENSLYVTNQISDIIREQLQREGLEITDLPYDWDVSIDDIVHYCRPAYNDDIPWDLHDLLHKARGIAFDKKYADYSYDKDARGQTDSWKDELKDILKRFEAENLANRRVINVGIGNGLECVGLFDNLLKFTAVDIAPHSLKKAKDRIPRARTVIAEAEGLKPIRTASQDIYISLRTYQSSYFDVVAAVREAYRVLKQGGIFIASIANGFIGEDDALIQGLVIPHTSVIDRDRPFELVEKIRRQLSLLRFEGVGIRSGVTEIFVFGRRSI